LLLIGTLLALLVENYWIAGEINPFVSKYNPTLALSLRLQLCAKTAISEATWLSSEFPGKKPAQTDSGRAKLHKLQKTENKTRTQCD